MSTRRPTRLDTLAVAVSCALGSPALHASPEAAHEHYVRAIELVNKRELGAARQEFERALAESPHPTVLYNLARVCLDLGERDAARRYGEQFLAQGSLETPEQQRADIQQMLEKLGRERPFDAAPLPGPLLSEPPRPNAAPSAEPPATTAAPACPGCLPRARVDSLVATDRGRTLGIALGATGTALLAAGGGILLWNAGQASEAERDRAVLDEQQPSPDVVDQQGLLAVLAHERAVSENRAAFRSVERFDVVGWSLFGVGAALLGTGVVLVLTHPSEPAATLSLQRGGFALSACF